mgnify:CR=1 FL=1
MNQNGSCVSDPFESIDFEVGKEFYYEAGNVSIGKIRKSNFRKQ